MVIGEAAQTAVNFETANEIHFDVNNSELVNSLERDLKGYKIAWDAGLPFDSKDWLISWPKLNQEKKILKCLF